MRRLLIALSLLALVSIPPARVSGQSLLADLMSDVEEVEQKMMSLAKAIPADKYGWRPAAGVRSIGEVVMHVASDNYFIPGATGVSVPPATGIKVADYNTVMAYEKRQVSNEAAMKELSESFAYLKKAMKEMPAARWQTSMKVFGAEMSGQKLWIMATTHLHEHLGQMIAYARSNGVKPPWSQ